MKQLITLLILFLFGIFAYAAPGGGKPHKITSYDYHDYTNSNITSKTFDRYQSGNPNKYTVTWVFDRSVHGQVRRHEIKKNSLGIIVRHAMNVFEPKADSHDWIQFNLCELQEGECIPISTNNYSPPISSLTSAMVPGIAWGAGGQINYGEDYYTYKYELLAVEDVKISKTGETATYKDCLKFHRQRQFVRDYVDTYVVWVCPNMGLVKRIEGGKAVMELVDFE